jgi:predicted DNA-binding ribbon-helix-helix protein
MIGAATDVVRIKITIRNRRTSMALERGILNSLTQMCRDRQTSMDELCESIADSSTGGSLASAIRTAVLEHFMRRCGT